MTTVEELINVLIDITVDHPEAKQAQVLADGWYSTAVTYDGTHVNIAHYQFEEEEDEEEDHS
jgi:hypothetical protein